MSFFDQGFRPFFFGAALWAAVSILLWLPSFAGSFAPPTALDLATWHAHEMVFGYAGAVIAGFLLTAVPNWTSIPAPKGAKLALIFGLWALARLLVLTSANLPLVLVAAVDLAPLTLVALYVFSAVRESGNNRNFVVVAMISTFILANGLSYIEATRGIGLRLGLAVILMLITLIGGRIIPNFTRNWLMRAGSDLRPADFGGPDKAAMVTSLAALLTFVIGWEHEIAGMLFFLAAVAGVARLARWQGRATTAEPLIVMMHIGYLWLPVGYLLMGMSLTGFSLPMASAVHALTTGAVATMTLIVMSRASLGHSGGELTSNKVLNTVFLLITVAAVLRIGAGWVLTAPMWMHMAGTAWAAAYALFLANFAKVFFPRQSAQ